MRITLVLASSFLATSAAVADPPPGEVTGVINSGNTSGAINSSNDVEGDINSRNTTGSINSSNDVEGGINSGNTTGAINSSNDVTGGINSGNTATVGPIGSGNTVSGGTLNLAPGAISGGHSSAVIEAGAVANTSTGGTATIEEGAISNTNTATATGGGGGTLNVASGAIAGGAGGSGGQGGSASANNSNNANNSSSVIVEGDRAAKRPYRNVATAYAPTVVGAGGSDSCLGSAAGGVSTGLFGISLGGTKKDEACRTIKLSRRAEELGMPDVACQILGLDPKFAEGLRRAGRDCAMSNFQGRMLPVGATQTMPVGDAVIPQPVRIDETPIQPMGGPERG